MKYKILATFISLILISVGSVCAADDQTTPPAQVVPAVTNTPADKPSLGTQAGEVARELKGTADESLSVGAAKVAESSAKVETEVQETLTVMQQQWDAFSKQLQEKTTQLQAQLAQQWQDFQKSFNAQTPKP